jgi:hypothetical protein
VRVRKGDAHSDPLWSRRTHLVPVPHVGLPVRLRLFGRGLLAGDGVVLFWECAIGLWCRLLDLDIGDLALARLISAGAFEDGKDALSLVAKTHLAIHERLLHVVLLLPYITEHLSE